YLRKSIVTDPFTRLNSNDNTPAVLHTEITEGDKVVIKLMPKGGGSENSGAFTTLLPGAGKEGVKDFVIQTVKKTGGKSCPPVSIGVGIGGTMDLCCRLAKQALFRPFGERNPDAAYARFEEEILESVNDLGIGPMGCGGLVTALDARVEVYPCHITALPVAVNFQCHAFRLASAEL
ncbi:MAG: fumarate hydratase, partial [Spirochaetaceae bacterium]|nr:fumarate hydratase [Spirochaetaceae bacterium]